MTIFVWFESKATGIQLQRDANPQ